MTGEDELPRVHMGLTLHSSDNVDGSSNGPGCGVKLIDSLVAMAVLALHFRTFHNGGRGGARCRGTILPAEPREEKSDKALVKEAWQAAASRQRCQLAASNTEAAYHSERHFNHGKLCRYISLTMTRVDRCTSCRSTGRKRGEMHA